jgi:CRP/FNR family transcriptional regulator, dissimilatory nitrate respiration regulator
VDQSIGRQTDAIDRPESERPSASQLRGMPIFADLEDRVLERLAAMSELRSFETGTRIFAQGDLGIPFCILVSGQMSFFRTAPDGTVTVVDVVHPNGYTGLQAVLTQMPVLTGVEAVAPSCVILIDGAGLRAMLKDEPSLATALLRAEAMDFRSLVLQVCDLKLRTTAQRLGYYLLELAPDKTSRSATLRLPFDKRLLAARLGCRQENLSRAFATLREQGVETRGARVVLHDIPRLRDYAVAFDGPETAAW